MAEVFLSALLPMLLHKSAELAKDLAVEHAKTQLTKLLSADAKGDVEELHDRLNIVEGLLAGAEIKQATNEAIRRWLSMLQELAYDADDLLDGFIYELLRREAPQNINWDQKLTGKVRDFFSLTHNPVLFNSEMSTKIKLIVEKIDSLAQRRANFGLEISTAIGPRARSSTMVKKTVVDTHSHVRPAEVFGREADVSKIVELLVCEEREQHPLSVLPIVGLGGLGKTTLAKMVYNDPRLEKAFGLLMWVSVNGDFNTERIVRTMAEIASGSGFALSDMDSLQRSLKEAIRARKYFLVLDDVWENGLKWEELEVLLKFGAHGSAVVVTTRSWIVSDIVRTVDAHHLAELSEDDSWLIFKQEAFSGGAEDSFPNLVTIGKSIVRKCGGLPLAARALGSMMRHKNEEEDWREVAESELWDLTGEDKIFSALRLSYSDLPSHLKQCFAFCALFPKRYEIEKDVLINLWVANGLVPSDDPRNLRTKANTFFKELLQRSFFQNVKTGRRPGAGRIVTTCQMHDLMRDLARMIMGNKCSSSTPASKGIKLRHLLKSDDGNLATMEPDALKTLRTLMLWRSADLSTAIGSAIIFLRALSLPNMGMSEFRMEICNLRLLRYLDLSGNTIRILPVEIVMLVNLQTLDLSGCKSLVELPKSITCISSLQHLYLEGCKSLRCMPSGMGKLSYLQTLTRYAVGSGGGSGSIEELKEMNLRGMLELCGLENVGNPASAVEANLSSKRNLEQLVLEWGEPSNHVADLQVPEAPPTCLSLRYLVEICQFGCLPQLPTPEASAETTGAIGSHDAMEVLQAFRPSQYLKELAIHGYTSIDFPTWLMGNYMQNLVNIVLADCSRCERLPRLWRLPALEVLEMRGMGSVKHMSGAEFYGGDEGTTAFPKLRKLKLHEMRGLHQWSSVEGGRSSFPHIIEIEISHCPLLTTMPAFPSVKDLRLTECPLLRPENGFFGSMRSLETLGLVSCEMTTLLLQEDQTAGSGTLRNLRIENCHQLMFQPPSYGMWRYMRLLENLEIIRCYGLYVLPKEVLRGLSSLKRLQIHWCNNLTSTSFSVTEVGFQDLTAVEALDIQVNPSFPRFHRNGLLHLPALRSLYIYSNHGLTVLPEFSSNLRELVIYNCWNLTCLPEGLGRLPALDYLLLLALNRVTSLPEEMQGYKALKIFKVEECANIVSLPVGLQRRLPSLRYLEILRCPELERRCAPGGEYWPLISDIPRRYIGVFNPERPKFTYISYS